MFSKEEQKTISDMVDKLEEVEDAPDSELVIASFDRLKDMLTGKEEAILKKYLEIDPHDFGFLGEHLDCPEPPADLVAIRNQTYLKDGVETPIPTQFLPKQVYEAFMQMNNKLEGDLQRRLRVLTGYRSCAFQAYLGLYILRMYEYDLEKTFGRVAMPGFSEHGYPPRQAVDFMTEEGSPSEEHPLDFEKTEEYEWLTEHAKNFGFVMSYPKDNADGIMFEPWHWRYTGV